MHVYSNFNNATSERVLDTKQEVLGVHVPVVASALANTKKKPDLQTVHKAAPIDS